MDNLYAKIARFFVENRQLSLLLVLASFAFGALSFALTPKQYNPEITLPAFRITTQYPGATAAEVEPCWGTCKYA
jgi:multidrug efflux pump subunit AcrB